jgi:hypothetical protein
LPNYTKRLDAIEMKKRSLAFKWKCCIAGWAYNSKKICDACFKFTGIIARYSAGECYGNIEKKTKKNHISIRIDTSVISYWYHISGYDFFGTLKEAFAAVLCCITDEIYF